MERFEGPEKKLEIILSSSPPGLRDNRNRRWTGVVRAAGAAVINQIQTPLLDAYLLSESSLFVWNDRMLLITCGQTSPVTALPVIFEFIAREQISFLFYERKSAFFPDDQPRDFRADEAMLKRYIPGVTTRLGGGDGSYLDVFYYAADGAHAGQDATLQVLMHDIDPTVGALFSHDRQGHPDQRRLLSKIRALSGCSCIDSHLFYPQGYSLNAVENERYFTVHVTPQPQASYTSVETNTDPARHAGILQAAVSIFKPGRVSVVLTEARNGGPPAAESCPRLESGRYRMADSIRCEFDHNFLSTYLHYLEET